MRVTNGRNNAGWQTVETGRRTLTGTGDFSFRRQIRWLLLIGLHHFRGSRRGRRGVGRHGRRRLLSVDGSGIILRRLGVSWTTRKFAR